MGNNNRCGFNSIHPPFPLLHFGSIKKFKFGSIGFGFENFVTTWSNYFVFPIFLRYKISLVSFSRKKQNVKQISSSAFLCFIGILHDVDHFLCLYNCGMTFSFCLYSNACLILILYVINSFCCFMLMCCPSDDRF